MLSAFNPKFIIVAGILFAAFMSLISAAESAGPLPPVNLRCEYLVNPLGIDVKAPRFFWVPAHSARGQKQTAYQILVSSKADCSMGDIWDSGKVASEEFTQVVYKGKPLAGDTISYWKVRYWDNAGIESPSSAVASFGTGLFSRDDWKGSWIGGANELRKEFEISGPIVRARAYICGLGYYELRINGEKVGFNVLDPAWTTYDKRALYVAYDITTMLRAGKNAVGVILGQGWYKNRALLLQMNLELANGKKMSVFTDTTWKIAAGPVVEDSVYNGEIYDARLETPGWDMAGFKDASWKNAVVVPGPKGVLSAQLMPPIQIMDTIVPLKMTNPKPGVFVFDIGQNASGWARLRVSGPRGTEVKMRFAELLYDNGMLNQENLRSARAQDIYILKGEGEEVYEPRFTYHGFRYVELTGFPGVPTAETIRGRVVYSGVNQAGSFACSKPVLNALQRIITWGQKTNLHSIPTDCSQRDERMGWMGDAQGTAEEAIMNFDMAAFYTNFVRDMRDVQDDAGTITDTVPHIWGSRPADPAWGTAYPLICWYMYQYYGDVRILEEQYDGLKKYVDFLRTKAENGLLTYSYYGDWVAVDKTPGSIVSSFYYYYDVKILADVAKILGKEARRKPTAGWPRKSRPRFIRSISTLKPATTPTGRRRPMLSPSFLTLRRENARGSGLGESVRQRRL